MFGNICKCVTYIENLKMYQISNFELTDKILNCSQ